ncbi:hypothetical protein GJAV_G00162940 [Gymnothorax javanicus]|nr:hypothetical protein GJAV_G00162940 [Gymnothorax javanicus]
MASSETVPAKPAEPRDKQQIIGERKTPLYCRYGCQGQPYMGCLLLAEERLEPTMMFFSPKGRRF